MNRDLKSSRHHPRQAFLIEPYSSPPTPDVSGRSRRFQKERAARSHRAVIKRLDRPNGELCGGAWLASAPGVHECGVARREHRIHRNQQSVGLIEFLQRLQQRGVRAGFINRGVAASTTRPAPGYAIRQLFRRRLRHRFSSRGGVVQQDSGRVPDASSDLAAGRRGRLRRHGHVQRRGGFPKPQTSGAVKDDRMVRHLLAQEAHVGRCDDQAPSSQPHPTIHSLGVPARASPPA